MKKCVLISILAVLLLTLIIPTGCKAAKFELSSLEINPSKVAIGDTAIVSVDLANIGNAEGTYSVTLSLDGTILETTNVTIPAESVRKVRFDVAKEEIGVYTIEIGGLSGQLQVVKPAEFELSSLVVTPKEVAPGEEVTVTVDVTNTGGLEGNYTCTLVVRKNVQESKEVSLDSEETKTITFTFTPSYAGGSNNIEVGELTEEIRTLRPADIKVEDVSISPTIAEVGSSVTVTVSVRNWGDVEGAYTVALKLDDVSAGTQSINVGGGETGTARLTVTENDLGQHKISTDGTNRYFTIVPVTPPGYIGYTYGIFKKEFFIIYPEGWEQQEQAGTLVAFVGPMEGGVTPNFSVGKETLSVLITPKEYAQGTMSLMESTFEEFRCISTEELTINGVPAARATYTLPFAGILMKGQQVILITDKTCLLITFTSSQAAYDRHVDTFDTIVNSFRFLP